MSNVLSNTPPRTTFIMPDCDVVLTPHWNVDPIQCLTISSSGTVYANDTLKAIEDTPVDLVIPSEINGIKVTSINYRAFAGCRSLKSIIIPEGVKDIGEFAFQYCNSLTSVTIPEGVTTIGRFAFAYCESLTSIDIPASVTTIGDLTFGYCFALTTINIHKPLKSISGSPWSAPSSTTINWLG